LRKELEEVNTHLQRLIALSQVALYVVCGPD
jgi:hypothetical protein